MPVLQTNLQDESHLNLLSIFHYILGGFCVLGLGFIILHFVMMTFFFKMSSTTTASSTQASYRSPVVVETIETGLTPTTATSSVPATSTAQFSGFPKGMMAAMVGFYVVFGLLAAAMATANFMSGKFIKLRKNKTFSIVVAAINCVQMPFGTVLGIFTIIVLMRPSVQSSYKIRETV